MISQMTNKHIRTSWGLKKGKHSVPGATLYQAKGANDWQTIKQAFGKVSSSKYSNVPISPDERISVKAPGGGGFGDPAKRDRAAIVEDVLEGYISRQKATEDYGFKESWIAKYAPEDAAAAE